MYDVITMGSSTVDAFAVAESELIKIQSKTESEELIAYPLGSKLLLKELRYDVGGNGTNSAVGLSKLDAKTAYLGKIGKDPNGETILNKLKSENVSFIGTRGEHSGFSLILYSELGHDRTILRFMGSDGNLSFGEVDLVNLQTKWFYFSSLLNESFHTMEKLAEYAKNTGIKIAFNPSATISKYGLGFIKNILDKTNLLILNDQEAEDLVGKGKPKENLMKLLNLGIPMVVITMGDQGILASDGKEFYKAEPNACSVVETTGAGDSCSSGILAGLIHGKNFETCIKMGMLNAESVLAHHGAQNKLLNEEEMEVALVQDRRTISREKI